MRCRLQPSSVEMSLGTHKDEFPDLVEIWEAAPNVLEFWTQNGSRFRVTALRDLRSDRPLYRASYERQADFEIKGENTIIWVDASRRFSAADGATIEECLRLALELVGSHGNFDK